MIDRHFLGAIFELVGTILVAFAALRVHHRFLNEHRVDGAVFRTMKREQRLGVIGVFCIIVGFFLQHIG